MNYTEITVNQLKVGDHLKYNDHLVVVKRIRRDRNCESRYEILFQDGPLQMCYLFSQEPIYIVRCEDE